MSVLLGVEALLNELEGFCLDLVGSNRASSDDSWLEHSTNVINHELVLLCQWLIEVSLQILAQGHAQILEWLLKVHKVTVLNDLVESLEAWSLDT